MSLTCIELFPDILEYHFNQTRLDGDLREHLSPYEHYALHWIPVKE